VLNAISVVTYMLL